MRDGQPGGEHADALMEGTRDDLSVQFGRAEGPKGIVAGEEFIARVASEGHLDLRPGEFAEQVGREQGAVSHRFVEAPGHGRQEVTGLRDREHLKVVVRLEKLGHPAGVGRLVERGLLKADAKGLEASGRNVP